MNIVETPETLAPWLQEAVLFRYEQEHVPIVLSVWLCHLATEATITSNGKSGSIDHIGSWQA